MSGTTCSVDAVTLDGAPIPETFIDAALTSLIALHDLRGHGRGEKLAHRLGVHRQAQDAWARRGRLRGSACSREVEDLLALPRNTLKIGIMDEERRTSVNLAECIRAVP